jgi:hypothetical protein
MTPQPQDIARALELRDAEALSRWIADGVLDARSADGAGQSLLHHAAAWGDHDFCTFLIARGCPADIRNPADDAPADVAAAWGHGPLADFLRAQPRSGAPDFGFASLADIRRASFESGVDQMARLVRLGGLDVLLALAARDAQGLTAQDMLAAPSGGDNVLLIVCQQGRLKDLLRKDVWMQRPDDFFTVWNHVPRCYADAVQEEAQAFKADLRQAVLQARRPTGLKKPRGPKI